MGMLKSYKTVQITKDHGVRCTVNMPREYPLHHHDYYEFELIVEGEIRHECNGKSMVLSRGDVYILSPNDVHRIAPFQKTTILNLCIYPEQCNKFLSRLLLEERYPKFGKLTEDAITEIATLHESLRNTLSTSEKYREARIFSLTTLLTSTFLELTVADEPLSSNHSYSTIARAMTFISDNLSEPITLEDVAAISGYSRTYFSRLFREIVGINFKDYLAQERINLASDLLINEKMSITEIVYAVGFNSFSSFWRTFKKYKGISPREFRGW